MSRIILAFLSCIVVYWSSLGICEAQFQSEASEEATLYVPWNSFLKMINILEVVNPGTQPLTVNVNLLDQFGSRLDSQTIGIAPFSQQDIILNALPGFSAQSYGLLELSYSGSIDGRLTFYRRNSKLTDNFDFVVAYPFSEGLNGRSTVSFNTFQPSGALDEQTNLVANWLSLVNLSDKPASFLLSKFDQLGNLIENSRIELDSLQRIDLEGGHLNPGPNRVGFIDILPNDDNRPYTAFLSRYGYGIQPDDIHFALLIPATLPQKSRAQVPFGSSYLGNSWLEVVNTSAKPIDLNARFFGMDGDLRMTVQESLTPFAQRHFHAESVLGSRERGLALLESSAEDALNVQTVSYHPTPSVSNLNEVFVGHSDFATLAGPVNSPLTIAPLVGDFNADGRSDLILFQEEWTREVRGEEVAEVFLGSAQGLRFSNRLVLAQPLKRNDAFDLIESIDVDQDGDLDFLISLIDPNDNAFIAIYTNNGDAHFTLRSKLPIELYASWVVGNFDDDSGIEIVVQSDFGVSQLYQIKDDFQAEIFPLPNFPISRLLGTRIADFDGDGIDDMLFWEFEKPLFSSNTVHHLKILRFTPLGEELTTVAIFLDRLISADFEVGDLDNDGDVDLVIATREDWNSGEYNTNIFHNLGFGQWFLAQKLPLIEGKMGTVSKILDFDGDSDLDLLTGSSRKTRYDNITDSGSLSIVQNRGDGIFILPKHDTLFPASSEYGGDINGDGRADFYEVSCQGSGGSSCRRRVKTFLNRGARQWSYGNDIHAASIDPARSSGSEVVFGTYNLFLSMRNTLTVSNITGEPITIALVLSNHQETSNDVEYSLAPYSTRAINIDDSFLFGTESDTYGTISVTSSIPGSIIATLDRSRISNTQGSFDIHLATELR